MMRAAIMRNGQIVSTTMEIPVPGCGQILARTLACGICGSDLHALHHGQEFVDKTNASGGGVVGDMDLTRDVVMGHELCAEIVEYGPQSEKRFKIGTHVCSLPVLIGSAGVESVGYSNSNPGGFAEFVRLSESMLFEVPNGLAPDLAALAEPMAVGLHAVAKARMDRHDVPLVIGCGPVGLSTIAALKLAGAGPIVASDFSPARRNLALQMGADIVVDPAQSSPFASWAEAAVWSAEAKAPSLPPWYVGPNLRPAVIFECVGRPGLIEQIMANAPSGTRIIVAGVCMERDQIEPMFGINKELSLQFVLAYTPDEFQRALNGIARGEIPVAAMITARVGIDDVPKAFVDLGNPNKHAKIIVEPAR